MTGELGVVYFLWETDLIDSFSLGERGSQKGTRNHIELGHLGKQEAEIVEKEGTGSKQVK